MLTRLLTNYLQGNIVSMDSDLKKEMEIKAKLWSIIIFMHKLWS